ncbi:uncharacterized protein DFE_0793 [Desulfovibrio ferrophilus]|uniref:Metallo-beta-lactamase domain-containing protein n=2 Tax=Desulfovibrio ferrophilus TaxID=241368 RepID=A0A2Z6AWA0_9BACT|nr:uncharacterized protein DFE_0793 [Desulfovibrio ferrophilus]
MKIKASPQFNDGKFHNINKIQINIMDNLFGMTRAYLCGDEQRFPKSAPPVQTLNLAALESSGDLGVTWLGHSTALIHIEGKLILTDPVFANRVSPLPLLGPKRFHDSMPITTEDLPKLDAVIISHDHYDHLDRDAICSLASRTEVFYVPLGVDKHLRGWGIPQNKIVALDWWNNSEHRSGLRFVATPAQHFSGRGLTDRNETLWASWTILGRNKRVFFSGDSGYAGHFKTIGDTYGPFDLTLIECGAYSQYWPVVHMMPEETIQAHQDLRGQLLVPVHWGTFNLAIHNWFDPMQRATKAASVQGVHILTPLPGEVISIPHAAACQKWWLSKGI